MHLSHVVYIHVIYSSLVQYEQLLYSGQQLGRRSISVSVILITHNHVQHIGITFIYLKVLSSIIYIWKHHIGHFTLLHDSLPTSKLRPSLLKSTAQLPEPRGPAHQHERRKSPRLCANQMASSWRGCLMSYITPCATMTTRLLMTFLQVT